MSALVMLVADYWDQFLHSMWSWPLIGILVLTAATTSVTHRGQRIAMPTLVVLMMGPEILRSVAQLAA